jgi:hypothetical protein
MNKVAWPAALEQVLQLIDEPLAGEGVQWAVIGSAASALQGCRVEPNDLDLLAARPDGVYRFAELMAAHTPATCAYPPAHTNWHSSAALPVRVGSGPAGFRRTIGRWYVAGFKVEMAHLAAEAEKPPFSNKGGILEFGPEIWPFVRRVSFAGYRVPVAPLEIQIESLLSRGLSERVEAVARVFREKGYDRALLQRSLSHEHLELIEGLLSWSD